jgi:probable phosphoglycerate mutase
MKGILTELSEKNSERGRHVWILRHGQTVLNAEDKIRAWLDIPLDETGMEEAKELGEAMRDAHVELDGIYTSDLLRTIQTSIEVSRETGIPILGTTKSLRPLDVGTLSGKDGQMVHKIIAECARNKPDEQIGGGETINIFKHRILSGMIGMLNSNRGLKLGFVSHSRGERALHAWVAAGCPEDLSWDVEVFLKKGEGTATGNELIVDCPLVLS